MGLERRGGGLYYYASRRSGRTVMKVYVGSGEVAEVAAAAADVERARRRVARRNRQVASDACDAEWRELATSQAAADRVVAAALEAHGWHRVRRQWRRKRGAAVSVKLPAGGVGWVGADLLAAAGRPAAGLVARAKSGNAAALAEVDEYLANPAARALYGDLGRHVLVRWATLYAGADPLLRRGTLRFAADLRGRLAGTMPTALDELVAERVVLAWLAVSWYEYQYTSQMAELDWPAVDGHTRRIERAHRVLMSACRTLAKVRQVHLPDILAVVSKRPARSPRAGPRLTR